MLIITVLPSVSQKLLPLLYGTKRSQKSRNEAGEEQTVKEKMYNISYNKVWINESNIATTAGDMHMDRIVYGNIYKNCIPCRH